MKETQRILAELEVEFQNKYARLKYRVCVNFK